MSKHNGLPEGWTWTTLGSVVHINLRADTSSLPDQTLVSFVPMPAVEAETGRMDATEIRRLGEVRGNYTSFQEGDVLFAKITPSMQNGKSAVARALASRLGFGSTEFHVLRPMAGIDARFVQNYIVQKSFRGSARGHMKGTAGQLRVPADYLKDVPFPLAPTQEQHRIVEVIEEQFSRLDAGTAVLERVRANLKRYRTAVLKAAVDGKLTESWREENPNVEPASELVQRILKERREQWEKNQLAAYEQKGKMPTKNWRSKYREPPGPDAENLPELPRDWTWVSVEQLADVGTGATPLRGRPDYYENGTIPWVTSGALNNLLVSGVREYITEKALSETNVKIFPSGSLLIAMYGEGKTRGKIAELGIDAATNQACAALVFYSGSEACQPYVKQFMLSRYFEIRRLSAGGVQPNLNLSIVRRTPVALPPLQEQLQIVAEIERRMSILQEVEAEVEANLKRAARLRQSILKQAFKGELVPQDPNDEPASKLLERIRQEREQSSATTRRLKKPARKNQKGEQVRLF